MPARPASCGGALRFVTLDSEDMLISEFVLWEGCRQLGHQTNHFAEMSGAHFALEAVQAWFVAFLHEAAEGKRWTLEPVDSRN